MTAAEQVVQLAVMAGPGLVALGVALRGYVNKRAAATLMEAETKKLVDTTRAEADRAVADALKSLAEREVERDAQLKASRERSERAIAAVRRMRVEQSELRRRVASLEASFALIGLDPSDSGARNKAIVEMFNRALANGQPREVRAIDGLE